MDRITITMPPALVAAIDAASSNRSGFIVQAARRELRRRERRVFLKALDASTPEPGLADVGLAEWVAGPPGDNVDDIVDPTAGKPIRWVPGAGWVEP